jgi:hypothetical protein
MGFFAISSVPDLFNTEHILEAIGRNSFAVAYDINAHQTFIWVEEGKDRLIDSLTSSIPGFQVEETGFAGNLKGKIKALSFYRMEGEEETQDAFHDLFNLNPSKGVLCLAFINVKDKETESAKRYAEALLSSKDMRETKPTSQGIRGLFGSSSVHRDVYKDSEELLIAKNILNSINEALLKNNLLYKIFLVFNSEANTLEAYLRDRVTILSETGFVADSFGSGMSKMSKIRAFPFGTKYCASFIKLYGVRVLRTITSKTNERANKGIPIGKLMNNGVSESHTDICVEPASLNLGFLITGLPGSGKTMEAMHISDRIINSGYCPSFIIAPTEEWNGFAISHGMNLMRLFSDSIPINFFRCPPNTKKEKFYQDLAIILSAASGAGPYKRPMEKCMLNAFRKIYQDTSTPDPVDVYYEIEESIIRLHGKKTNVGIKYTKHGENIKAALESLRIILNNPNYSTKEGVKFEELLVGGAVFDISSTSIATKPFLYALVLNQLYALASCFDTLGDDKLRMFICVEESQIIFKEEDSPAVEDLKQRIQDFRKRGIGLMLLAHNISDIDLGIRRLSQTRLYMKQAPDSAYLAARELIFPGIETDKVIEKLKLLDSRVGALSFITRNGNEKVQEESVFIKTEAFQQLSDICLTKNGQVSEDLITTELNVTFGDDFDASKSKLKLRFLGELVQEISRITGSQKLQLVPHRKYLLCLLNERDKVTAETLLIGKSKINLFIDQNKLLEIA